MYIAEAFVLFCTNLTDEPFVNKGFDNIEPSTTTDLSQYFPKNDFKYIGLTLYG